MIWYAAVAAVVVVAVIGSALHRGRCPSCGRRFQTREDLNHHVEVRHLS